MMSWYFLQNLVLIRLMASETMCVVGERTDTRSIARSTRPNKSIYTKKI